MSLIKEIIVKEIDFDLGTYVDKDDLTHPLEPHHAYLIAVDETSHLRYVTDDLGQISQNTAEIESLWVKNNTNGTNITSKYKDIPIRTDITPINPKDVTPKKYVDDEITKSKVKIVNDKNITVTNKPNNTVGLSVKIIGDENNSYQLNDGSLLGIDDNGNIVRGRSKPIVNYGNMVIEDNPYSVGLSVRIPTKNYVVKVFNAGGIIGDITIDSEGNIYTSNRLSNNVSKITPQGVSTILGTTGINPNGIVIDSEGNIYTANRDSNNVSKITPQGVSTILGTTGSSPIGIVIDSEGNIYTANYGSNNISKITPQGVSTILGATGTSPVGITIDSEGNIYTTNTGSNNVSKITPQGVSTILGTTGPSPKGIAIDSEGNIYTANYSSNNISKITPQGASIRLPPLLISPNGITIDSEGNIYITNTSSNNVSKIIPDGDFLGVNDYGNIVRLKEKSTPYKDTLDSVAKRGNFLSKEILFQGGEGAKIPFGYDKKNYNYYFGSNMHLNSTGGSNMFFGFKVGDATTTGSRNTVFGYGSFFSNTSGNNNSVYGFQAMYNNTTGYANIAIGYQALAGNTTGYANVAVGYQSLFSNILGYRNTALGDNSLRANIGNDNTGIGSFALWKNTTGTYNVGLGSTSLLNNTTGSNNVAVGVSLYHSKTGSRNTSIGFNAGYAVESGSNNVYIGSGSAYDNGLGSYNVALGDGALAIDTGGYKSGGSTVNLNRNVIIGSNVKGKTGMTDTLAIDNKGDVGTLPEDALLYGGFNTSDRFLKINGKFSLNPTHMINANGDITFTKKILYNPLTGDFGIKDDVGNYVQGQNITITGQTISVNVNETNSETTSQIVTNTANGLKISKPSKLDFSDIADALKTMSLVINPDGTLSVVDKQDKLISGSNIKTINGSSILGSGDLLLEFLNTTSQYYDGGNANAVYSSLGNINGGGA